MDPYPIVIVSKNNIITKFYNKIEYVNWLQNTPDYMSYNQEINPGPFMIVSKNFISYKFYFETDYENWKNANPDYKTWDHKYIHGLGNYDNM